MTGDDDQDDDGQADDGTYACSTCGVLIGMFIGRQGWLHYRGDGTAATAAACVTALATGYGVRYGQLVYQVLTRLAAAVQVERSATPGVKPVYWRRLTPQVSLPPLTVCTDRDVIPLRAENAQTEVRVDEGQPPGPAYVDLTSGAP